MRITITRVNLWKLYGYLTQSNTDLSKYVSQKFESFVKKLCNSMNIERNDLSKMNFYEFQELVKKFLLDHLKVTIILNKIRERNLPLTPMSIIVAYESIGDSISTTSAKALLSLLRQLKIISEKRFPQPTLNEEEKIVVYLSSEGKVSFGRLYKELKLDRDKAKLSLLKLNLKGLVKFDNLEIPRELIETYLQKLSIPEKEVEKSLESGISKLFVKTEDRFSGKVVYVIEIPDDCLITLACA